MSSYQDGGFYVLDAAKSSAFQMRVPPQHPQILVSGDTRDLHDVQPFFEHSRRRLVTQVSDRSHSGTLLRFPRHAGKHIPVQRTR